MADLGEDTAVVAIEGAPGRYRGRLRAAWEIWGPMGGYVAAVALRAAGAHTDLSRPASLFCHYLVPGAFDEVEAEVRTLRRGRSTESMAVTLWQGDRRVLEATVMATAGGEALDHHDPKPPDVPGPDACPDIVDLLPDDAEPPYPFWRNYDARIVDWIDPWPPRVQLPPVWQEWLRVDGGTWDDPWVDACRTTVLADVAGWPAAHRHHAWADPPWWAPSLDLYVAYHQTPVPDEWLLVDGWSPVAADGLVAGQVKVWSASGRLVASGASQLLCRPMAVAPPPPTG